MATLSWRRAPARAEPTQDDLEFYRALTLRLCAPPTSHMMRYCGPQARHLAELARDIGAWKRVVVAAAARWPELPAGGKHAADGTALHSLPERIGYETLRPLVRPPLTLVLHPILFPGRGMKTDFGLAGADDRCRIHIEVTGMFGSDLSTRNGTEAESLRRLREKQRLQAEAGRPPLRVVFSDTLADPDWLRATCEEAVHAALASLRTGDRS